MQFVAAVGLTLILFVLVANLLVWSYARGVLRAALDEGVRAGARSAHAVVECEARARAVLDDLLGGAMGAGVEALGCAESVDRVTASASARFQGWLPAVPAWTVEVRAVATREVPP